jgi:hypothetical protein
LCFGITPVDAKPSGVGLYVLNLVKALSHLEDSESLQFGRKGWKYVPIFKTIQASPWQNDIYHLS